MFLGLPDPDPLVRRIRILLSSRKKNNKNLYSYCFATYCVYDFLSLKKDLNVASKSNTQKTYKISRIRNTEAKSLRFYVENWCDKFKPI
jgi:hypothetical protein